MLFRAWLGFSLLWWQASPPVSLVRASEYGTPQAILDLLRSGANPNQRGFRGVTPLMMAAKRGLADPVRELITRGARANDRDALRRTPLMFAASSGDETTLDLLLAKKPSVNDVNRDGGTALMAAAAAGNPELVRRLLAAGARVDPRDSQGRTALLTGARGEDQMKETEFGRPWAETADQLIHRDVVVRLLLNAGADVSVRDQEGETALFTLDEDAARELIAHHADVNARNAFGATPLIKTSSDLIARMLIDAGADPNAKDSQGRTALMQAASEGDLAKTKILLERRAKVNPKDVAGMDALTFAKTGLGQAKQGLKLGAYRQIIDLLEENLRRPGSRSGSVP